MPPIVFTVLQGLFLVLLYVFVARAVRWVIRDVTSPPAPTAAVSRAAPRRPPRTPRTAPRELVVHFAESAPRLLRLDEHEEVTFGRHSSSTVVLSDPYTSDFHARIAQRDGQWVLMDQGSTNGTYLNQVKIAAPTPLAAGDQIGIGKTTVEVRR